MAEGSVMIGAVIQVRMGSSRLPGKALKEAQGRPLFEWLLMRVARSSNIKKIVISTTTEPQDDGLAALGKKLRLDFFGGSTEDVLDRYYQTVVRFPMDQIVRI